MINEFLLDLSITQRRVLYNSFGDVMKAVMLLSLFLIMRKYQLKKTASVKIAGSFLIAYYAAVNTCQLLYNLTDGVIPGVNLGVAFLPFMLVVLLLGWILKANPKLCADISVPVFILGRGVGIIGCVFIGCCHGARVPWGLYSYQEGATTVPTMVIDTVISWIIAGFLFRDTKKGRYSAAGDVAAKGIFWFGMLRFVIDILRDNNKLFWVITAEGICGVIYMLVGLFLRYGIKQKNGRTQVDGVQAGALKR